MKPTDDTIALVVFLSGRSWVYADEVRHMIPRLGFEEPSAQWVVARLTAMTKEDAPRFESRKDFGCREYAVTHWAATGLSNAWLGFSTATRSELISRCPCGRSPDPGIKPEGGCRCVDDPNDSAPSDTTKCGTGHYPNPEAKK